MNIYSLLHILKELSPFIVCIFTYISLLFVYKTIFKVHRNNPISYIISLITTVMMYYAFIYIFKLSRTDYFLDGIKIFARYFTSFGGHIFMVLSSFSIIIKSFNGSFLSIYDLVESLFIYLKNVDVKTCAYIAFHYSYRFKKDFKIYKEIILNEIKNFFVLIFKANQINCVYTC